MTMQVIKGNWQLSGGHKGTSSDDRTAGSKAVADFDAFVQSGITTFDTADIYGPSEKLIGEYIKSRPQGKEGLQILTKFCKFGSEQVSINQKLVTAVRPLPPDPAKPQECLEHVALHRCFCPCSVEANHCTVHALVACVAS